MVAQKGKDILLAGQKSGTVWALDPDAGGKLLWRRDFGDLPNVFGLARWYTTRMAALPQPARMGKDQ